MNVLNQGENTVTEEKNTTDETTIENPTGETKPLKKMKESPEEILRHP